MADEINIKQSIATAEPTFWYPMIPQEQLANEPVLLTSYRRSMGAQRIMGALLIVIFASSVYEWIRGPSKS